MTFEEWLVTDLTLKQIAASTENTFAAVGNIVGTTPSTYGWFNRRTLLPITPPYLKSTPLTQDDIDNAVLVELETGGIAYSFPPIIVPTSFTPVPTSRKRGNDNCWVQRMTMKLWV
ncbi:hypothetical protein HC928_12555 [bacterium]|nr:hypothetical protein [bacterium]